MRRAATIMGWVAAILVGVLVIVASTVNFVATSDYPRGQLETGSEVTLRAKRVFAPSWLPVQALAFASSSGMASHRQAADLVGNGGWNARGRDRGSMRVPTIPW
jgi:hypothetical protein